MNTLKKTQRIRITHAGSESSLNLMNVYTTVAQYQRVLDYYSAKCVEHILETRRFGTTVKHSGVAILVTLED